MTEISATVPMGRSSERHNYDPEFRETMGHMLPREDGVVELSPYMDYARIINQAVKPYIDEYNLRAERRYQEACERYQDGIIKV